MIVFTLPGGKILHVQPRALEGGVIRMAVVCSTADARR